MDQPKGLLCQIYRSDPVDYLNGGISAHAMQVVLVGEGIPEISEASVDRPAVELHVIAVGDGHLVVRPVGGCPDNGTPWMAGGCFIYTCDSRFSEVHVLATGAPIPLHDRTESWELHSLLST